MIYAEVIGDPIAHSRSPLIHRFWLDQLGLQADFRAAHVVLGNLAAYLAERRTDPLWRGCSVTRPHKQAVMQLLDGIVPPDIGAVNCIAPGADGLSGWNTDVAGIIEALRPASPEGCIAIIGAGGAARAALAALGAMGIKEVRIIARNLAQGTALLASSGLSGAVYAFAEAEEALAGCHGVINATPLGMTDSPDMPPDVLDALTMLKPGGWAMDMVYAPLDTPFLAQARRCGLSAIDGLHMLIGQAAQAFEIFFSVAAPRDNDAALRARLTS